MTQNGRSRRRTTTPKRALQLVLLVVVLLAVAVTVSAQDDDTSVGEVVILHQEVGPEGINTIVEIPVLQDTFISSGNPNTNYGRSNTIRFGHNAGADGALRPLLQFSLASIPQNATINTARFRIFLYQATPGDQSMPFQARQLANGWNENVVTWNSHQPAWGEVFGEGSARATPLGWTENDVTPLVRDWYNGTHPNNGFTAIGDERPEVERQRFYWSKEAGNGLFPRLVVDYTVAPPDTTPPTASVNALPTWSPSSFRVSWDGQDNQGGSGIDYFDVQYRASGGGWTDWRMRTTNRSATFEGGANNVFYEFRARAVDKAGNVQPWPGPQANTRVDTVAPTTSMSALPEFTITSSFTINWSGFDGESGVASYDLQGRLNGGQWQTILEDTTQTSYRVSGLSNFDVVEFRVRATDVVGNVQAFPENAQAETLVILEPFSIVVPFDPIVLNPTAPMTDTFTVQWVGFTAPGTTITQYSLRSRFRPAGGSPTAWTNVSLPSPTAQSVEFTGPFTEEGTYEFEVRAINSAGQTEPFTGTAEAFKIIDLQAPFIEPIVYMPIIHR